MPQFVLLLHECPDGVPRATHWDVMLQFGNILRTWVLQKLPAAWRDGPDADAPSNRTGTFPSVTTLPAEEIQPHRIDYLIMEGPLSAGRGSVTRVDRGDFQPLEISDCRVRARLQGVRISGLLELTRPGAQTPFWRLSFGVEAPPME